MRSAHRSAKSVDAVKARANCGLQHQVGGEGDLVGSRDEEAAALHGAQRLFLVRFERVDGLGQRRHLGRAQRVLQDEEPALVVLARLLAGDDAERTV